MRGDYNNNTLDKQHFYPENSWHFQATIGSKEPIIFKVTRFPNLDQYFLNLKMDAIDVIGSIDYVMPPIELNLNYLFILNSIFFFQI